MGLVAWALRRPVTVLVLVAALLGGSFVTTRSAPADIFPTLGIPVVYVVQPYAGMTPSQMESQLVYYYEYHFLYIAGVEHIESTSIQGIGLVKVYFHPGTDIAQALSQVTAMAFRATAFMPPGVLPPFIVRFDAGSVPIGQLVFSSPGRSEAEMQDLALNRVRPVLATLPGVSAPPPSGGKVRTISVLADPDAMRAYGVSPDDLAAALAHANVTLPSGNVQIGSGTMIATTNAVVDAPTDLANVPLRIGPGTTVFVRDVARVEDAADIVYNVALVDGRRTVYMPVTKRADASTLDVVAALRVALPEMRALVPGDVRIDYVFDQSGFVTRAIASLVEEGALGALLTALVVLAFLRSWRSALIVVVTIPTSIAVALVGLRLSGQTVNIMTLGGLALAVGILVDESTVAVENIETHRARGKPVREAVTDAMREVLGPRLLAMLCVLAVFAPAIFMVGVGRALFVPLALAVGMAMIASFFLSSTLVPVLCVALLRTTSAHAEASLGRVRSAYGRLVGATLRARWLVVPAYLALCAATIASVRGLPTESFPRPDTGEVRMQIRAPVGTPVARTVEITRGVEEILRAVAGRNVVKLTLANIGNPAWTYPVNTIYTFNKGPQEAVLWASLGAGRPAPARLEREVRRRVAARFPGVAVRFEAGDVVSQVLRLGARAPVEVTVSGKTLADARMFASRVLSRMRAERALRDVEIPAPLDYPSLAVSFDRERAGQYGVTADRAARSLVAATSSSALTTPIFWVDPRSGVPYRVAVVVPARAMRTAADLLALPVASSGPPTPTLGDVATLALSTTPGEVDHYNNLRSVSITAAPVGPDLGAATTAAERAIAAAGAPPRGTFVALHGEAEQMRATLAGLTQGLGYTVIAVLLLLLASFQSWREPLAALSATPGALAGVAVALVVTHTTINVESLMGAIMAVGVCVANGVLLASAARDLRAGGATLTEAARGGAVSRVRAITMTSVAMIAGMLPTAIALGEGGEQSAPLGIAVIGGIVGSTLATFVVVPSFYALIGRDAAPTVRSDA